jgi:predicted alpha/beta superfamily hydrolase
MIEKFTLPYPAHTGEEERTVYVYLPEDFEENEKLRYPVLYMFDGHNVFLDEDATYGKSWGLADYLDYTDTPLIVAAVECNHHPDNGRLSEYSPYDCSSPRWGSFPGRGDTTMKWFTKTFKPLVDRRFRTVPDREHTFIAGSSMGGLMSLYAVSCFNTVFSRAAALSPSLDCEPKKLEALLTAAEIKQDTVLYMDMGETECGKRGMQRFWHFARLMAERSRVTARIVPDGRHCEASWEQQNGRWLNFLWLES